MFKLKKFPLNIIYTQIWSLDYFATVCIPYIYTDSHEWFCKLPSQILRETLTFLDVPVSRYHILYTIRRNKLVVEANN